MVGSSDLIIAFLLVLPLGCSLPAGEDASGTQSLVADPQIRLFLPERVPAGMSLLSIGIQTDLDNQDVVTAHLTFSDGHSVVVGCVEDVTGNGSSAAPVTECLKPQVVTEVTRNGRVIRVMAECASETCADPIAPLVGVFGSSVPTEDEVVTYLVE